MRMSPSLRIWQCITERSVITWDNLFSDDNELLSTYITVPTGFLLCWAVSVAATHR